MITQTERESVVEFRGGDSSLEIVSGDGRELGVRARGERLVLTAMRGAGTFYLTPDKLQGTSVSLSLSIAAFTPNELINLSRASLVQAHACKILFNICRCISPSRRSNRCSSCFGPLLTLHLVVTRLERLYDQQW